MKLGAVILAAGFGTRLGSLTEYTPKPLLRVGGRPVISHLVDRLTEVPDLERIVVVVNDRHPDAWHAWRSTTDVGIDLELVSNGVVDNDHRRGAVADLALAVSRLDETAWTMVLAGDNLIDEPLAPHVELAIERGHPVVLCRDLGDDVPPGRFGEITVDDDDIVTRFREKPARPESPYAATCTYLLAPGAKAAIAEYLRGGEPDSPGEFVAWLAMRRPVIARPLTGRYFDIGDPVTLADARAAYDRQGPPGSTGPS